MNERHGHRHGVVRRILSRSDGKVIVALAAAFTFGAIDQYLGAVRSPFLTEVSGMSAPWLLVPFLAGAAPRPPAVWPDRKLESAGGALAGHGQLPCSRPCRSCLSPPPGGLERAWG